MEEIVPIDEGEIDHTEDVEETGTATEN